MSEDKRRNLRDLLDEFDAYFRDFEKEVTESVRNGIFNPGPRGKPFIAGFAFNLGPDGKPTMQVFGDNPVHRDGFRAPINEQMVDEKNGLLRIIIEMPGVEKEDIEVEATEDTAMVTAENGEKRYKAELSLKAPVRADSGKAEYKNGMLEISFSLKDKANKGFKRVNVV